jgi:peptidoglycan-associated lipoprotein
MDSSRRPWLLLVGLLLALFLFGCQNRGGPTPDSTVLGPSEDRFDLVGDGEAFPLVEEEVYGELESEGLFARDENFNILEGEQIRGELPVVYFDFDQSFIRPADRPALDETAAYLEANPQDFLLVEGYCDWKGTTEYNLALGERRAQSVVDYLADLGVDPTRMETLSMGDLEADATAGPEGRALQRKAELIIVR